jgi:putative tryptophan/tyrosine transport system substrate-binding protein
MLQFFQKGRKTMKRREFIALIGASVTWPFAALAQQAGRTYRLGCLFASGRIPELYDAFFEAARRHGFIAGQNLTVDIRDFSQHLDLLSAWADELSRSRVDVIAAVGDLAIRTAQNATKDIPILAITDDMVGAGLVNSMARPGGNTTGVSILATELDGKRQELLIEAVPGVRRMAALADANRVAVKLEALKEAARKRNIDLSIQHVARGEEIAAAIEEAQSSGAEALNVLASPLLWANRKLIMDRVAVQRLPAIYQFPEMAEEGGFAGYGPRSVELWRDYGRQLVQLLLGTKPADIPVEQPTKFELVINLKTAKAMGVTVPEALLARADEVIE